MTEVAKVYGGSLYDLAAEESLQAEILEQLGAVSDLLKAEPEYLRLLSTPSIPKSERCGLLDEALKGQVHPYLLNFTKILCENSTLSEFFGCAQEFRTRYNADNGIAQATVISAVALSSEQQKALAEKLTATTGKKVDLQCKVDPTVLGGIRLEMDGVQMDGTVESRLSTLKQILAKTTI